MLNKRFSIFYYLIILCYFVYLENSFDTLFFFFSLLKYDVRARNKKKKQSIILKVIVLQSTALHSQNR